MVRVGTHIDEVRDVVSLAKEGRQMQGGVVHSPAVVDELSRSFINQELDLEREEGEKGRREQWRREHQGLKEREVELTMSESTQWRME